MDNNEDEIFFCTACFQPVEESDVEDGHSPCCGEPVADTEREARSYND